MTLSSTTSMNQNGICRKIHPDSAQPSPISVEGSSNGYISILNANGLIALAGWKAVL